MCVRRFNWFREVVPLIMFHIMADVAVTDIHVMFHSLTAVNLNAALEKIWYTANENITASTFRTIFKVYSFQTNIKFAETSESQEILSHKRTINKTNHLLTSESAWSTFRTIRLSRRQTKWIAVTVNRNWGHQHNCSDTQRLEDYVTDLPASRTRNYRQNPGYQQITDRCLGIATQAA
jgi:hypothetical protein